VKNIQEISNKKLALKKVQYEHWGTKNNMSCWACSFWQFNTYLKVSKL